jgi:hypothetical protein
MYAIDFVVGTPNDFLSLKFSNNMKGVNSKHS